MSRNKIYHYFVEGECEKKLINELKKIEHREIESGKVDVMNVIFEKIPIAKLLTLRKNTIIILVYDTDVHKTDILEKNLETLSFYGFKKVVHIQSIINFEDEIVHSTNINKINEFFKTNTVDEFKKAFINHGDIYSKLKSCQFNIKLLWCRKNEKNPFNIYSKVEDLNLIKPKKLN